MKSPIRLKWSDMSDVLVIATSLAALVLAVGTSITAWVLAYHYGLSAWWIINALSVSALAVFAILAALVFLTD